MNTHDPTAGEVAPVELDPDTAAALATVYAWGQAFDARDLDRLLALSAPDIELGSGTNTHRGHDAVRRLVHLQSYGVAQHVRPHRYLGHGSTITVEALIEHRWVENGELAETTYGVAVFDVSDGRVHRFDVPPVRARSYPHMTGS